VTIGVSVVGAGYWGKNLVRNFAQASGGRLVSVCDLDSRNLDAARAAHPEVETTTSLDEVLADSRIQAVAVATPAESHRAVVERCLDAGKDVFVEKPLATSVGDAAALVRAARAADRIVMVGHLFLYDRSIQALLDLVRTDRAGDLRYITVTRTSMGGTARLDTNIVWDALIHDAYVVPAIAGRRPERVSAVGRGYLSELEDVVFACFDFGGGVVAECYASWYALEKARQITVVGSKSVLRLDEFADPKLVLYRRRYEQSDEVDPRGRRRWRWLDDGAEPQAVERGEPLREECEHFLHCVATRETPRTEAGTAMLAVEIIEACQRSLERDGAWVSLESVNE
jgi:UDP-2-acetamido-3-amino-2,3-dideoxy-glucuronate N-acetyltransferase